MRACHVQERIALAGGKAWQRVVGGGGGEGDLPAWMGRFILLLLCMERVVRQRGDGYHAETSFACRACLFRMRCAQMAAARGW